MDVFKFNMTSVLSSNFIKYCKVVFMMMTVISSKMDLIKPIMIAFFEKPNLCNSRLMEFAWNFVLNQMFYLFEVG